VTRGKCLRNRRLLINRLSPQQPGRSADSSWRPSFGNATRLLIEALSFIRTFAQALRSRLPIDQAVGDRQATAIDAL